MFGDQIGDQIGVSGILSVIAFSSSTHFRGVVVGVGLQHFAGGSNAR